MRVASIGGRAHLVGDLRALDIADASKGRFTEDPHELFADWEDLGDWATALDVDAHPDARPFATADLQSPVGHPTQVFAIGLNYAEHASESKLDVPADPLVFTKFASSFTGADVDVVLKGDTIDWEAELVVVIGRRGRDIPESAAWDHVAGLAVGQDLSDRTVQFWGTPPQFSLGKSGAGFAPVGPWVTSLDEVGASHDPADLTIGCVVTDPDGTDRVLQSSRTSLMLFSVPTLIEKLSAIVELLPGDVIFTGTPSGVGLGKMPPTYLIPGQVLRTEIEGVGSITQRFIAVS